MLKAKPWECPRSKYWLEEPEISWFPYYRSSQNGLSQVLSPTNLFRPNKRTDRLFCLLCIFDLLARMVFRHSIYHILCTWIDWYVYMNRVSFRYYHISVAKRWVWVKVHIKKLKKKMIKDPLLQKQAEIAKKNGAWKIRYHPIFKRAGVLEIWILWDPPRNKHDIV